MRRQRVVLCYPVEPCHVEYLQRRLPEVELVDAGQERIAEEILQADIFIGHAKVPVDWEAVVRRGRLRFIQSSAAGLDHCLVPAVIDSDIVVCSASGLFANQVAEQAMVLTLGLLRDLPTFFRQQQQRRFIRQPTDDLHGKRVGIVGFGGNGRRLAEVLMPYRVTIRATDHFPVRRPEYVEWLGEADRLEELAAGSDILVLCLPLNASTHRLINARVLDAMPGGSYLINVARGQVVDEPALIAALADGRLKGAGLDVTYTEPLPKDSPLWNAENVLITPHVGAQSHRRVSDTTRFAADNVRRFLNGQPLWNEVDKRLGFPHPDKMVLNDPDAVARIWGQDATM
ncbi:MAG: phosphoglycerate dehydrogenase [Pirellulaceae bacterium]|nr:MAG: phosphoglycerate dehydrogenase [Pirellulaceae bacterium]